MEEENTESIKLAIEIVKILRTASSKDVAEDVFGEISQIWEQNIADCDNEDYDPVHGEYYWEEYDLFFNKKPQ
jgi:hypothetical protein